MGAGNQKAIELIRNPPEGEKARRELNKDYYITSFLEDGYLYHTTTWTSLRDILREGFLAGDPTYLKNKRVHQLHPHMICFTTSKWRHLSNLPLPGWIGMVGITHICYLRIPFPILKDRVKPVIYSLDEDEIRGLITGGHAYYLATLRQGGDGLREEYGELFKDYLYHTWYGENEWRMRGDKYPLPPETEVYVSTRHQLKVAQTLTGFPVHLDREIMELNDRLAVRNRVQRRIRRIVGEDLYKRIKAVEETKGGEVTLYDVKRSDAKTIIEHLTESGYRVEKTWEFERYEKDGEEEPYVDLFVNMSMNHHHRWSHGMFPDSVCLICGRQRCLCWVENTHARAVTLEQNCPVHGGSKCSS